MLDLQKDFEKHEKRIMAQVKDDIECYKTSRCSKILKERHERLKKSNDLDFWSGKENQFETKLAFPLVKEQSMLQKALISLNFRAEPLITVSPAFDTSKKSADVMQTVINENLKATRFRAKAFSRVIDDVSDYGVAVTYCKFVRTEKSITRTKRDQLGGISAVKETQVNANVVPCIVNILQFFQDPEVPNYEDSRYVGHEEHTDLSTVIAEYKMNPNIFIEKNIREALKIGKDQLNSKPADFGNAETPIVSKYGVKKTVYYGRIPIDGNEESLVTYYLEMIGNKIVKFYENPHDLDLRPYTVFCYYKRPEYWWGNANAEFVLPHEKFLNTIMSLKGDNALRAQRQLMFYRKGSIDPDEWQSKQYSGGMIGVELNPTESLQNILMPFQTQDISLQTTDSIVREVKENLQLIKIAPNAGDFSRTPSNGGMANQSATAQDFLEEIGSARESYIIERFSFALSDFAKTLTIMLQQYLGDTIDIRTDSGEETISKEELLGDYDYNIETSFTSNKASQLIRMQNVITSIMNNRGTQDPAWMEVKMPSIVRAFLKQADLGNVDDIYPSDEELQQKQAQAEAQAQAQAMMPPMGGMPPVEGMPPMPPMPPVPPMPQGV
jgi:hypothetical protein